jgi:anthranilate synthase component 2
MKKIIVIDNYDSFTYNLVHLIEKQTGDYPDVYRNDEIPVSEIEKYSKILISPGPGIPSESGICIEAIQKYGSRKSILGICLGHQAVCEAFGGKILNLSTVYHGIASPVKIKDSHDPLFRNIPPIIMAGRYHSWVISKKHLPACFKITCEDENGIIMGISHESYDVKGLQFHPESVLTEHGYEIIKNWIEI